SLRDGLEFDPDQDLRWSQIFQFRTTIRLSRAQVCFEFARKQAVCPLWVKSRHCGISNQCPLYPQKRTLELSREMSALCQKQTWHDLLNARPTQSPRQRAATSKAAQQVGARPS